MGGMDCECEAGLGKEFDAAGRGGGEDEHELIMAGSAELAVLAELARFAGSQGPADARRANTCGAAGV